MTSSEKKREDIHHYDKSYDSALKRVKESSISKNNKALILKFEKTCHLEGLSKPRRIKLISSLAILSEKYIKKDFDKCTKEDLKETVLEIENKQKCSIWTKQSYRAIIKKFYKWLEYGDDYKTEHNYPKIVSWINTNIKKKDQPKIKASDIITEKEIKKLIDIAETPRDKAFISLLYELGARISEIGNLRIKDLVKDKYSFIIDLEGKTGHRTPRVVISDPYITAWLNMHPQKNNPDNQLWIMLGERDKNKPMDYQALRAVILRLKNKAKIKKRIYPHLFRHTRVTHLLMNKQINEAQAKVYFGWVPSSKMLSEYSHLISSDVNDTILEIHGIKRAEKKESLLKPRQCPRCETINNEESLFCNKCGYILDTKTALKMDKINEVTDDLNEGFLTKKDPTLGMKEYVNEYVEKLVKQRIKELTTK